MKYLKSVSSAPRTAAIKPWLEKNSGTPLQLPVIQTSSNPFFYRSSIKLITAKFLTCHNMVKPQQGSGGPRRQNN